MAFYLLQASYTADAIKALVASPQDREADVRAITEALGGTLHQVFLPLVRVTSLQLWKFPTIRPWLPVPLSPRQRVPFPRSRQPNC